LFSVLNIEAIMEFAHCVYHINTWPSIDLRLKTWSY
jgi:hypothetical protein